MLNSLKLLLLLLLCTHLQANETYSVDEFIDYLTNTHSKPKILKSQVLASEFSFNKTNALTDWKINTSIATAHTEPYQSSSFSTSFIDTNQLDFSISRPILTTGGALTFRHSQQKISQSPIEFGGYL